MNIFIFYLVEIFCLISEKTFSEYSKGKIIIATIPKIFVTNFVHFQINFLLAKFHGIV
jgi:hypothetical protein